MVQLRDRTDPSTICIHYFDFYEFYLSVFCNLNNVLFSSTWKLNCCYGNQSLLKYLPQKLILQ